MESDPEPSRIDVATQTEREDLVPSDDEEPPKREYRFHKIRRFDPWGEEVNESDKNQTFRNWHERMQREQFDNSLRKSKKRGNCRCCTRLCGPCVYIDSVGYDTYICLVCCKYRTFKAYGTYIFLISFIYISAITSVGTDFSPGGTYFTISSMFLMSLVVGNAMTCGLPPAVGHIGVGIFFGSLPLEMDLHKVDSIIRHVESVMLIIVLVRAAIHFQFGQTLAHFRLFLEYAILPYLSEFLAVLIISHFLLSFPWEWSAMLGLLIAPVCLSYILASVDPKNERLLFVGKADIIRLLIAASTVQMVFSIYASSALLAVLATRGIRFKTDANGTTESYEDYYEEKRRLQSSWFYWVVIITLELASAIGIGFVLGLLGGLFPDRRNSLAPYFRIAILSSTAFGLLSCTHYLEVMGVGVITCLTMAFVANNIWAEFGWQQSNPVSYFFALAYFYLQPLGISLLGYQLQLSTITLKALGYVLSVPIVGLLAKELCLLLLSLDRTMPTTMAEKVFIMISWLPKGITEALLASRIAEYVNPFSNERRSGDFSAIILQILLFSILVSVPLASILRATLLPRFYKKQSNAILLFTRIYT